MYNSAVQEFWFFTFFLISSYSAKKVLHSTETIFDDALASWSILMHFSYPVSGVWWFFFLFLEDMSSRYCLSAVDSFPQLFMNILHTMLSYVKYKEMRV